MARDIEYQTKQHTQTIAGNWSSSALRTLCYPSFFVGLQPVDFVKTWLHLGHIISHNCDDSDDLCAKNTSLIGQVNNIICTFRNVNCSTKLD